MVELKVINVVGARPNYMKVAPIAKEMKKDGFFEPLLVHTGQHYDENMSKIFFNELGLPEPDVFLDVGSASHAVQTAKVMVEFEKVMEKEKPDLVLVVGDINSTLACSLVAAKLHTPVAHVEAGLRSNDWRMPEEVNRVLTDRLSTFLLTSCADAEENLAREGITEGIHFVGNTMIDSLSLFRKKAEKNGIREGLGLDEFALATLHRPENVDDAKQLKKLVALLELASKHKQMVFPVHPRTRKKLEENGLMKNLEKNRRITLTEPLGYLEFLNLEMNALFVLTDSGGVQEETTFLGVPCLTVRKNTERPITVEEGTNTLVGFDEKLLKEKLCEIGEGKYKHGRIPEKWDGKASRRICEVLEKAKAKEFGKKKTK